MFKVITFFVILSHSIVLYMAQHEILLYTVYNETLVNKISFHKIGIKIICGLIYSFHDSAQKYQLYTSERQTDMKRKFVVTYLQGCPKKAYLFKIKLAHKISSKPSRSGYITDKYYCIK